MSSHLFLHRSQLTCSIAFIHIVPPTGNVVGRFGIDYRSAFQTWHRPHGCNGHWDPFCIILAKFHLGIVLAYEGPCLLCGALFNEKSPGIAPCKDAATTDGCDETTVTVPGELVPFPEVKRGGRRPSSKFAHEWLDQHRPGVYQWPQICILDAEIGTLLVDSTVLNKRMCDDSDSTKKRMNK